MKRPCDIRAALRQCGVTAGMTVLCALSGGADSVCLLSLLKECAETRGIRVEAAHLNHKIGRAHV